jgi:3-hydroxyisobutyrate dehydrogenase-like beta-hydroxyacid dehydrogenase
LGTHLWPALASAAGWRQDSRLKKSQSEKPAMNPVVAVIAPGAMGAGTGARLVQNGLTVLTSLRGRSEASVARAHAAGMRDASDDEIASADLFLSVLPPGEALALAERFAPKLKASNRKPVYVECNAVSPPTVECIAAAIAPTGCPFVDAGIIGGPPKGGYDGPTFYASGPQAPRFAALRDFGLDIRVLGGPLTAASALKMSYGGITKGITAVAAAMLLAATRGGSADALFAELKESQPQLLAWFARQIPPMPPKAYRWVAEMEEVSGFAGENPAAKDMYAAIARFYEHIAKDINGAQQDVSALKAFVRQEQKS